MLVTFIRHGESTDNLRPVWAGWKDAPLSSHGMNQARALGQHWANTHITAVYCSDLKRAHSTALALVAGQSESGKDTTVLTPVVTPLLREQNFGIAEGKLWAASPDTNPNAKSEAEQVYYTIHTRHDKFEGGESLDDVAARAERAIDEIVWPHVQGALSPRPPLRLSERVDMSDLGEPALRKSEDAHIVLVSHGLAISELIAALLRHSPKPSAHTEGAKAYKGLRNTGWTQVMIDIQPVPSTANTAAHASEPPVEMEVHRIYVHSMNNAPHLTHVKRQAGGIGSAPHDEKQRGIQEFFGGGASSTS